HRDVDDIGRVVHLVDAGIPAGRIDRTVQLLACGGRDVRRRGGGAVAAHRRPAAVAQHQTERRTGHRRPPMTGAEPTIVRLRRTAPGPAPETAAAYRLCRRIAAEHGRTYFLATRLLAPERRPAVHALYAFARVVDDIVDTPALRNASGDRGRERAPTGTARTERPPSDLRPDGSTPGSHPAAAIDRIEQRLRTALHQHEPVFGPQ